MFTRMTDVKVMSVTFLLPAGRSRDRDRFSHGSDVPHGYVSHYLQFTYSIWSDKSRSIKKLHSTFGHWTHLINWRKPTMSSASHTQPKTEVTKWGHHPCTSMWQSHPFRSLQETVWTDNDNRNKQEPMDRQNLPTVLPGSATCLSHQQKDSTEHWLKNHNTRKKPTTQTSKWWFQQPTKETNDHLLLNWTFQAAPSRPGHANPINKNNKDKFNLQWLGNPAEVLFFCAN